MLSMVFILPQRSDALESGQNTSYVETFDGVATGTTSGFNDVKLSGSANTDLVVLDGRLWIMYRGTKIEADHAVLPEWDRREMEPHL